MQLNARVKRLAGKRMGKLTAITRGRYEGTYICCGLPAAWDRNRAPFPCAILIDSVRVSLAPIFVLPVVSPLCFLFIPDAFAVGSVRILQVHYTVCFLCIPEMGSLASTINSCFSLHKDYFGSSMNTAECSSFHNLQSWPKFVVTLKPPLG